MTGDNSLAHKAAGIPVMVAGLGSAMAATGIWSHEQSTHSYALVYHSVFESVLGLPDTLLARAGVFAVGSMVFVLGAAIVVPAEDEDVGDE